MSHDGKEWTWGEPRKLTGDAWEKGDAQAGVHAISSCVNEFAAVFSNFSCDGVEKKTAEKGRAEKP